MKINIVQIFAVIICVSGCVNPPEPVEPVVDVRTSLEYVQKGLRPEQLLFPEYLLMEDFELYQHGRIPDSILVGCGVSTKLALSVCRRRFTDVLQKHGWGLGKVEIGRKSFRVIAENEKESVEIRAVQGVGITQVFLLYKDAGQVDEF